MSINPVERVLRMTAAGIALAGFSALGYSHHVIQRNFQNEPYYKKSMEILKNYSPAMERLGKPLKVKYLNLFDFEGNHSDGKDAKLTIPVKGSKSKGELYMWASRPSFKDKWMVERCDLRIGNNLRTFYINPDSPTKHTPVQGNAQSWIPKLNSSKEWL